MFELTGVMQNLSFDFMSGKAILTLVINEKNEASRCFDKLHGAEKIAVKIEKYRPKRSLNANNYAWKLINEIANELSKSKEEIYLKMLKEYGQSEMISVLADIPLGGFIKYYEEVGESELNGKNFKHYKVFKGSSEYDSKEMSIFIDGIIDEAKGLNIQTLTPSQIAELKSLWGNYETI